MRAARFHARGGPELLVYEEAPQPVPEKGDALVRVRATGITPAELGWDASWTSSDGQPRLPVIPAHEVSGVIAALAPDVTDVRIGDTVYGLIDFWRNGAAAEWTVVRASDLAPKPRSIDDDTAATLPLSALTAWQALFDHAGLRADQRVLIHGATGGVGVFAVQLAHWCGAHVTATGSVNNADFLSELGADEVIDYHSTRFENVVHDIDVVLDPIGGETQKRSWQTMRRGGTLVSLVAPIAAHEHGDRERGIFFVVQPNRSELVEIAQLVDTGVLRPVVGAVFPLAQARAAYQQGLSGHHRGKIVLHVND
jgi:NADPH:quinone reductase-like Zn-dependent oxidoreductase